MSKPITIHGVFLSIFDVGVLISGNPGIGKSELALSLISRGHSLVADDMVIVTHKNNELIGSAPELGKGFLIIPELGFLDIAALFSANNIKEIARLQIVFELTTLTNPSHPRSYGDSEENHLEILDKKIPKITFNNSSGRKMEILIETAVKNFSLQQHNYNSNENFINKQREQL